MKWSEKSRPTLEMNVQRQLTVVETNFWSLESSMVPFIQFTRELELKIKQQTQKEHYLWFNYDPNLTIILRVRTG